MTKKTWTIQNGTIVDQNERAVCHVVTGRPDAGEIARLIAAAPKMAALLDRIMSELLDGTAPMADTWWSTDACTMADEIGRLLAAARGEP